MKYLKNLFLFQKLLYIIKLIFCAHRRAEMKKEKLFVYRVEMTGGKCQCCLRHMTLELT